jgi:peptidyl-prolyl cis-trans isomerase C
VAPAQLPPPAAAPAAKAPERVATPAINAKSVAVTVNGEPIHEGALQRFLRRVPPDRQTEARPSVITHLVDNVLVDQYLRQSNIKVEAPEIDAKVTELKAEVQKDKLDYATVLKEMEVTEEELRSFIAADLRWEKYLKAQATDKVLGDLFAAQKEMFDGSQVRVRHILLIPEGREPEKVTRTKADLTAIRQQIDAAVTQGMAGVKETDALAREKARARLLEDAFSAQAKAKSACPSKQQGGDVGWFDRAGTMVEPFAKVAFSLKPFQMSELVETPFGFHLILLLDRKPGKDVKFEEVKPMVLEVQAERVRNALVQHMRQTAKVVVTPVPGK